MADSSIEHAFGVSASGVENVVRTLESAFAVFRHECDALPRACWIPWPVVGSHAGEWLVYPLVTHGLLVRSAAFVAG